MPYCDSSVQLSQRHRELVIVYYPRYNQVEVSDPIDYHICLFLDGSHPWPQRPYYFRRHSIITWANGSLSQYSPQISIKLDEYSDPFSARPTPLPFNRLPITVPDQYKSTKKNCQDLDMPCNRAHQWQRLTTVSDIRFPKTVCYPSIYHPHTRLSPSLHPNTSIDHLSRFTVQSRRSPVIFHIYTTLTIPP